MKTENQIGEAILNLGSALFDKNTSDPICVEIIKEIRLLKAIAEKELIITFA